MNKAMWADLRAVFALLSQSPDCRAIVLAGSGKGFTAGLDLHDHVDLFAPQPGSDAARQALAKLPLITAYQDSISSLERARVPVIAAVHGPCVGGGVDLICAADIRLASSDAWFCILETRLGLAADVGTLQRLPRIMGNSSVAREWAFTSRRISAAEALQAGLLSSVHEDPSALQERAIALAKEIAANSPVAVAGTKANLNYSRDHSVADGLAFNAVWNAGMLQTADLAASAASKTPHYAPLLENLE